MKDFWKGLMAVLAFQWLLGDRGSGKSGCGCGGCLTWLILALCFILYLLGLL